MKPRRLSAIFRNLLCCVFQLVLATHGACVDGPSGEVAFLAHREGKWAVWASSIDRASPRLLWDSKDDAKQFDLSRDGSWAVVADVRGALWLVPLGGAASAQEIVAPPGAEQPAVSPDGRHVVYVRFTAVPRDDTELELLDVKTRLSRPLPALPGLEMDPAFDGAGGHVLFSRHLSGAARPVAERIWRLDLGGGEPEPVTPDDGSDRFGVRASPARPEIVYASNESGTYDLWRRSLSGPGEASRLTTGPGAESSPDFSPDGEWIVYESSSGAGPAVRVISRTGQGDRPASPPGWRCRRPRWLNAGAR